MNNITEYKALSDADLVAYLRNGDENAFIEIFNRYQRNLHIHAYQKLGDFEQAKEIVKELFLMFWKNRADIPQTVKIEAHLYTMTKNRVLEAIADHKDISMYSASFDKFIEKGEIWLRN